MKLASISIRTRILLWHGLLLALILTAFGITAHRLQWENELARLDRGLDEPLSLLHRSLHFQNTREGNPQGPNSDPPRTFTPPEDSWAALASRGIEYAVWNRNGIMLSHSKSISPTLKMPPVTDLVPFVIQRRSREGQREAWLITPPRECFLTAISIREELLASSRLGWWLFALGAGVLGIGLLVDAWILRHAIQPVEDIISAAERISRGNLSTRIETPAGAELSRLTHVLNHTFASLDHAFTQQARFSADVAHELRTPVSVLITETQSMLERERSNEDYRDTIATCLRSARRMGGLIESLLDLAQIKGDPDTSHSLCDLATLTTAVIDSLQPMATTHRIELHPAISAAPCRGNATQLTQIITNLISNAVQHNQCGGHANIETRTFADHVTLRVCNTGPGIPATDLPHVFDRFYRTDTSRNRKTGGAGLGLAISKAIADAHEATLTVTSTPAEGTTFTLTLPVVEV